MNKNHFSASTLRIMLISLIVILLVVLIGGFYFAQNWLLTDATNIKAKGYNSVSGNLSTNQLANLKIDVNNHKDASTKSNQLFYSKQSYTQDVKKDINEYASRIGITISDISPTSAPTIDANQTLISGVTAEFFSVTIKNPVQFNQLFEFVKAIESNLPFIKLTGISMDSGSDKNVTVKPMIIEVYTK